VLLANLSIQRQSVEKLLLEAHKVLEGNDQLLDLRYAYFSVVSNSDCGFFLARTNLNTSTATLLDSVTSLIKKSEERVSFWQKKFNSSEQQRDALQDSLKLLVIEQSELERKGNQFLVIHSALF